MPVIEETVVIARPARQVFDFLMVAENLPRRDSSMLECVQVGDGPVTLAFHPPSRAAAAGPIVRYRTGGPLIL